MSIKFKLTCESCRRKVEHTATAEQYQKLLQKLRCTFPCPCCSTVIQVEMMAEGLSYSTVMPTSGVSTSNAVRDGADLSGSPRTSESAFGKTVFPIPEPDKKTFAVAAEDSFDGPVSHVPFLAISGDAPRKFKGSVSKRFFQWYSKQPMLVQCGVLSPLLMLLVLLVLWEPNGKSTKPAIAKPEVKAPKQQLEKSDSAANSQPDERTAAESSGKTQPSPATDDTSDTPSGIPTAPASSNKNP